ncbi:MAG: XdhC family protein [Candidatus Roseilinea sp.]|uniref:XdhC family protein n=1 Tax=Candidatus Roseilinea sp. TaxID=2838777 RepID=UPI0040492726
MLDLLDTIDMWRARGDAVALATVVKVTGSAPRPAGAKMAVSARGEIAGSVSGGCVEGAVIEIALEVIENGRPQLVHFGIADETAWSVGLMCGGQIDVFIERLDTQFDEIAQLARARRRFAVQTLVSGDHIGAKTIIPDLDPGSPPQPTSLMDTPTGAAFFDIIEPPARLYIIGGTHISIALTTIARTLGYYVTVIDPRQVFATPERFAHADKLVVAHPQRALTPDMIDTSTCFAILTHDPKVDDPALKIALNSPARYIGALGSRKTHAARLERLRQAGFTQAQLDRIHAPIGLDIGARTPEEIAVAIAAEMVKVKAGSN